jgi:hypothetical protein
MRVCFTSPHYPAVNPHPGGTFAWATTQRAPRRVSEATKVLPKLAGETQMDVAGSVAGDGMPKHEGTESTIHGLAPLYFHLRHHRTRCSVVVQRGDSRTRNIRCSLSHLAILDPSELYRRTSTSTSTSTSFATPQHNYKKTHGEKDNKILSPDLHSKLFASPFQRRSKTSR